MIFMIFMPAGSPEIRMFLDPSQNSSLKHHFFGVLDGLRESWSC